MPSNSPLDQLATALILGFAGLFFAAWMAPLRFAQRERNPALVLPAPDTLH